MNFLVTGARAPVAVALARSLIAMGHSVWTTDSLRMPVGRNVPGVQGYLRLPAPALQFDAFERGILDICHRYEIHMVVPASEEVFWLSRISAWPKRCRLLAPDADTLQLLHHKSDFAILANKLGVGAGTSYLLSYLSQRDAWLERHDPSQYVFKRVYSRLGTEVIVAPTVDEIRELYLDPSNPWLAQPLLNGEEVCVYNIAKDGELVLHLAYRPKWRAGQGASVFFEPFEDRALRRLSAQIVAATKATGQVSFDVIQTGSGPVPIECNLRGTAGAHLAAQYPLLLASALMGSPVELPKLESMRLSLPLLWYHPFFLTKALHRAVWAQSRCAMAAAGIGIASQLSATLELIGQAALRRKALLRSATSDIEWNGHPP